MSMVDKATALRRSGQRNSLLILSIVVALLLLSSLLYLVLVSQSNPPKTTSIGQKYGTQSSLISTLPVLFSENFTDNSQNWNLGNRPGYSSVINNGSLILTETNHHLFREPLPLNTTYSDFTISTSFTLQKGTEDDSVGLYLRTNNDSNQGYYIDVYGNGKYDIAKITVDTHHIPQPQYILEPTSTSTLHPLSRSNTLTVIMKGSSIALLINSTLVATAHDSTFTTGGLSLFVDNAPSSNGITASFSNVTVYNAPSQLPH